MWGYSVENNYLKSIKKVFKKNNNNEVSDIKKSPAYVTYQFLTIVTYRWNNLLCKNYWV